MYSKICVNGNNVHPLWKWMKVQPRRKSILGNAMKWNFTKFLIDKDSHVVKQYGPIEEPLVIEKDLSCYLSFPFSSCTCLPLILRVFHLAPMTVCLQTRSLVG
uniref:phospholipid-hydroperoxide glutathione peroxidase n=1 Tax=Vombatus ursinus TaxID=29139 RepID=A0A4X2KTI1_VOMUR